MQEVACLNQSRTENVEYENVSEHPASKFIIVGDSDVILFFDTETTGLSRKDDHIVQIAWALTDQSGGVINEASRIIRPSGYEIPPAATSVHGISTQTALRFGEDISTVLSEFTRSASQSSLIVAHNMSFDLGMLTSAFRRIGDTNPLTGLEQVCTMKASTQWCALPSKSGRGGYKWPKLEELHSKLFGQSFENAHDAMADVRATRRCYFKLVDAGVIKADIPSGSNDAGNLYRSATPRSSYDPKKTRASDDVFASKHRSQRAPDNASKAILKCPSCSQKVRVPSEKRLRITCPSCREVWISRT